jgi:CRISPR-associated protein Cas2
MSVELLVSYDVATDTATGRKRLRRVAKICEGFGQRVQKSVFECALTDAQLLKLVAAVRKVINLEEDSLRIYRLAEPLEKYLTVIGRSLLHDQRDTLIV